MKLYRQIPVYTALLVSLFLCSGLPVHATTTVNASVTNLGGGVYEYLWTVDYGGETADGKKFGTLEVYLPEKMGAATDNPTTLNGTTLVKTGTDWYSPTGPVVTYPWNAGHYPTEASSPHPSWTQATTELESPDQEGFDPDEVSEIAFGTNATDSAAAVYNFSYRLDRLYSSFFYELHDARESDPGWKEGTVNVVPLPPSALLLASGLLGLAGWRFRRG